MSKQLIKLTYFAIANNHFLTPITNEAKNTMGIKIQKFSLSNRLSFKDQFREISKDPISDIWLALFLLNALFEYGRTPTLE